MSLRGCSPAACSTFPQRPQQRHSGCSSGAARGCQHSRLGSLGCIAVPSAASGSTGAGSSIGHKFIRSPHVAAGAAAAAAAAWQCRLRRRRHPPSSSQQLARRRRGSAAQQPCRCLVDATALPVSAPAQQQQPGTTGCTNVALLASTALRHMQAAAGCSSHFHALLLHAQAAKNVVHRACLRHDCVHCMVQSSGRCRGRRRSPSGTQSRLTTGPSRWVVSFDAAKLSVKTAVMRLPAPPHPPCWN